MTLTIHSATLAGDRAATTSDHAITTVDTLPQTGANHAYVMNRAPLQPGYLAKLPITAFRPAGWLGKALELQASGLTGHLGEISVWLTRTDNAWLNQAGSGKWGWEEMPYWLRGFVRLAYLRNDDRMIAEARAWIDGALNSQRPHGDFGPIQLRHGKRDLWAQMLMLNVLQSFYEATNDARVLPFMTRYFQYQLDLPEPEFLKDYWENSRGGDNLASVLWLYNRTGDKFLLQLATKIHRNTADWAQPDNLPNWHVVNIAECFREPATYSLLSGNPADREAAYRNFRLVRERYGQVPGGMYGADENARPGYIDPHQATETCGFVEQILSNMMLTEITGDLLWAANTEDVAFNSLPAAFTPDYRALRYLTAPNQVVSDAKNHAPGVENEGPFFLMNPFSSRCCQHNHASAWVNYTEHVWMATHDDGLAAILYAAGELHAQAGAAGGAVTLVTETNYPFEETVRITIKQAPTGGFPLYLRVPAWASGAAVQVNGGAETAAKPSAYLRIDGEWKAGDVVTLKLPMHIGVRTWAQNKNCVSVNYGPLTFSLKIAEKYAQADSNKTAIADSGWQPGADPKKWPSFEILPDSPWNYGLSLDSLDPAKSFTVVSRAWPSDNEPFINMNAPLELHAKGRLLPSWTLDEHGLAAAVPQSPVATSEPETELTLVPMGGARLRVSAFPVVAH